MNKKKTRIIVIGAIALLLLLAFLGKKYIFPQIELRNKYNAATEALNNQKYDIAILIFEELGDFDDAKLMLQEANYQKALYLLSNGSYDEAFKLFTAMGKYKDSENRALTCKYSQVEQLLNEGNYKAAETILASLEASSETSNFLLECQYQRAEQLFRDKKYSDSLKFFQKNTSYKESTEYIYKIAVELQKQKNYSKAKELFYSLVDYKDSKKCYTENRRLIKYAKFRKGSICSSPDFIKCSKKQADKYMKQFYGTWYDMDSGKKMKVTEFTRNGKEWGIHSMYLLDSPILVYYYLDAPKTLIAEEMPSCNDIDDEFGEYTTYNAYKVIDGEISSEIAYTYCTLTKEQYTISANRPPQEIENEETTEQDDDNTEENSDSGVDEQALIALASQYIDQAIQMTRYAGRTYEVKEFASIHGVGGEGIYRVSFRVYFPSLASTKFICVYLRKDYMTNSYVFSKGSTN